MVKAAFCLGSESEGRLGGGKRRGGLGRLAGSAWLETSWVADRHRKGKSKAKR